MPDFIKNIASFIIFNFTAIYGNLNYKSYKRNAKNAANKSEKRLIKFIENNKNTVFGKAHNFDKIKTIEDYQKYMPYTTFDDYKELVEKTLKTGEQNLVVKDKVCYFAGTSGTTGDMKRIPVVKSSFKPFLKCGSIFTWNLKTVMKQKKRGLLYGKVFNLSEMGTEDTPSGIRSGFISGYFTYSLKRFLPLTTCVPTEILNNREKMDAMYIKARYAIQERNVICMNSVFMSAITDLMNYIYTNHEMLIQDIEEGKINSSISLTKEVREKLEKRLKPDKKRADELKVIFNNLKPEEPFANKIWKRLSLIISIGTGDFAVFDKKLRKYCGNDIAVSYSMYAASEATIACAFVPENKDYTLLYDSGFYEFIPVEGNPKPLCMNKLEIGKEYEIVVTNYAGLYRYKLLDVVRVIGYDHDVPILEFAYRKNQVTDIGGVHLTVETLTNIMNEIQEEINVNILDYSFYINTENPLSRYEVFVEFEKEIPNNINLSETFDKKLGENNENYRLVYNTVALDKSVVYVVKPGTYEKFRENKVKTGVIVNQIKTVRLVKKTEDYEFLLSNSINK